MLRWLLVITFSLLFNLFSNSQNKVLSNYRNYFKVDNETIFLHLNKTTYLRGEQIWFKGYLYDRKYDRPFRITSNFYCGLYDFSGKLVEKKAFLVKDGMVNGSFEIGSKYTGGDYYIKAYTNQNNAFIQKIKILSGLEKTQAISSTGAYDFQFLPEGGHIVEGVENVIGFKLINSKGSGVKFVKGLIVDENNNLISTINSNEIGLGKFKFNPSSGTKYKAEITLENNQKLDVQLPVIESTGIAISVANTEKDSVKITLRTNSSTYDKVKNRNFKLLIHRDGQVYQVNIPPFKKDLLKQVISVNKANLLKGVNILTLFDNENRPLSERLIFNDEKIVLDKPHFSFLKKKNDSLVFTIKLPKIYTNTSLSISALPYETISYNSIGNSLSEIYLKPYIRGAIENPLQYFKDKSVKTREHLDLLLLTQGWRKYDWKKVFNEKERKKVLYDRGMSIIGKIGSRDKNETLLFGTGNTLSKVIPVGNDNVFRISDLMLKKGERIRFTLANRKNQKLIAPKIKLDYLLNLTKDSLEIDAINLSVGTHERRKKIDHKSLLFTDNTVNLEEVLLDKRVISKRGEKVTGGVVKPFNISISTKKYKINEDDISTFNTIPDYLQSLGLNVSKYDKIGNYKLTITTRLSVSLNAAAGSSQDANQPAIYLDGVELGDENIQTLLNFPMRNVEEIYYDKHGMGQGLGSPAGVITIITKKGGDIVKKEPEYLDINVKEGFSVAKNYYTPIYNSNKEFRLFGTIGWKPDVIINNGEKIIKVLNTNTKGIIFYIEGMDENGNLISDIKIIDIPSS